MSDGDYAEAKTSVWWDIENCQVPKGCDANAIAKNITTSLANFNYRGPVSISAYADTNRIPASVQHALSSTGISLNHVPAGEDASDKKILVDMLFWAVDNPAPANYLLISGDRDFSNALHQLRMRRYNILLAQPNQASLPLVAAATTVWLWTCLSAGGQPLHSSTSKLPNTATTKCFNSSSSSADSDYLCQPGVLDSKSNDNCFRPQCGVVKQFKKAPHEFFQCGVVKQFKKAPHEFFQCSSPVVSASPSTHGVDGCFMDNGNGSCQLGLRSDNVLHHPPSHGYHPEHARPVGLGFSSSAPRMNVPDIGTLNISGYPSSLQSNVDFYTAVEKPKTRPSEFNKPAPLNTMYRGCVRPGIQANYWRPRGPGPLSIQPISNDSMWRNQSYVPTSEYMLNPVSVILTALQTLKIERVMPTEANITDCIRFGDPRDFSTDVQKALNTAIEQNMVVKQRLGAVELYVGRNEKLWNCVNPIGGNPNQYSNAIWDNIQQFLTSCHGRSAILTSNCRYEAALLLRNQCLESLALGDVLQILSMVVHTKKWIIHKQPGWQPVAITLKEKN